MPARWEPDFDVYEATLEGSRAVFFVDLAAMAHAPVETHPVCLQIRVEMKQPREDGLRAKEEAEALFALEDAITARLGKALDTIYVGRFVAEGHTTFVYYAREEVDPLPHLGDPSPYEAEWLTDHDPDWEFFADFLAPDELGRQQMMNRRLLDTMREGGDRLDVAREVDHFAYFESKPQAQAASRELASRGFRVDEPEEAEPDEEAGEGIDRRVCLQFHRNDALDGGRVDEVTAEVFGVVVANGGSYDGWGCAAPASEKG